MGCYTHQKQPLAHPLGANFMEGVAILRYRHQRVYVNTTFTYAKYGDDWGDVKETGKSYGKDPTVPSNYRISAYGIKQFQGNVTKLFTADMQASCLLNPKSKLNFTLGCRLYDRRSETATKTSNYLYCSLRWSLKSWYHNY